MPPGAGSSGGLIRGLLAALTPRGQPFSMQSRSSALTLSVCCWQAFCAFSWVRPPFPQAPSSVGLDSRQSGSFGLFPILMLRARSSQRWSRDSAVHRCAAHFCGQTCNQGLASACQSCSLVISFGVLLQSCMHDIGDRGGRPQCHPCRTAVAPNS